EPSPRKHQNTTTAEEEQVPDSVGMEFGTVAKMLCITPEEGGRQGQSDPCSASEFLAGGGKPSSRTKK
ncbi:hypothetical protein CSUI_006069, partial [Cystoisospora suis]